MAQTIKTHPGAILKEELAERGLSANRLAMSLDVPAGCITEICNEARSISPDTAIRLAEYLGGSAEFWLNLQAQHDLSKLEAERGEKIRAEVLKTKTA